MKISDKEIVDVLYRVYPKVFNNILDAIEQENEEDEKNEIFILETIFELKNLLMISTFEKIFLKLFLP